MLRRAGAEDVEGIDRLNRAVLPENYTRELYDQLFADGAATSGFVVEHDGKVVGYVLLFVEMVRGRATGHVMSLGVDQGHRRRGYADDLMRAVRDDAVTRYSVAAIRLHVRKSNRAAQSLYVKLGYARKKKIKRYYVTEDAYLMETVV